MRQTGWTNIVILLSDEPLSFLEWLSPVNPKTPNSQAALQILQSGDGPQELVSHDNFIKRRIVIWADKPTSE